jgi:predicted permease
MLATPMAVSSYTMADSMDSDGELAGNCVIFSTPLSCITLFFWLFLFKSLGMF